MTIFVPSAGGGTPAGVSGVYDYNSLKQAVQDWFARSDVGGYIDYFIQKAEAKIYRDIFTINQGVGVQPIETSINTTINANGVVPLPVGYLGIHHLLVSLNNCTFELVRKNPEFIYTNHPFRAAGNAPEYFAREGSNFIFGPFPDSEYAITGIYWQRFPQLTVSNSTTWMTNVIPTILLAACNGAIARFLKDAAAIQLWDAEYTSELHDYVLTDRAEGLSGSSLAMTAA